MPGLLRLSGYLHIQKHRDLPHWYAETQPQHRVAKFRGKGSPQMFVFKSAMVPRRELEQAKWDPEKIDVMYKSSTARFDSVEALRYAAMEHPEPSKIVGVEDAKFIEMAKKDLATANEWRELDRRRALRTSTGKNALRDADYDGDGLVRHEDMLTGKYDWNASDE